ncbi:MAG TPA: serpin family protein [Sphingobacteriaceae bacterium]|nr:serpin family protein [Sphingobacteriaceae bacterium]
MRHWRGSRGLLLPALAVVLIGALLAAGCGLSGPGGRTAAAGIGPEPEGPGYEVDLDNDVAAALNRMGLRLYRQLAAQEGNGGGDDEGDDGGGLFISPASIAMALAMTYNGARGETQAAMAQALSLEGLDLDTINESYYALIEELAAAADPEAGVQLRIANGIWHRQGVDFYEDFLDRNRQFYGAAVETADFDDPATVDAINGWVSDMTEGRVTELLEEIRDDSVMFLINALYFKGNWTDPFDPSHTRPMPFNGGPEILMMFREGEMAHFKGEGFEAVRLPYGEEGRLAMYVFVPDEESGLDAFTAALTYDNWKEWQAGFAEKVGRVGLPRFRLAYETKLNDALKAMGMEIAFDRLRADFSGMRPVSPGNNLFIGDVLHETFLQVDEEGSEAAGATSVEIREESALIPDFELVADRPFFVAIQDDVTGVLLFAGAVTDPQPVK